MLNEKIDLAFDHTGIVHDAIERVRVELEVSGIATAFVGTTFTLAELRSVYEAIWGVQLDETIIDPQSAEGRHDVLDERDIGRGAAERRSPLRTGHVANGGCDARGRPQIGPHEDDARIRGRR